MSGPETNLVRSIRTRIKREWPRSLTWKMHGSVYMEAGIPDIVCCVEGRFIALEVKAPKAGEGYLHAYERTSREQRYQIGRVRAADGAACTVVSPEDAVEAIRQALAGSTLRHLFPMQDQGEKPTNG